MTRFTRPIVVLAVALGLVAGPAPALAFGAAHPSVDHSSAGRGDRHAFGTLPVPASDVTASDDSLRTTSNEVVALSDDGSGRPTVTKLRTASEQDAEQLTEYLDRQPGVVAAPNARVHALGLLEDEPLGPSQWNLQMIGAPTAWATTQGAGVVVAVIDTGVDATHPDLAGRVLGEVDLLPDVTPTPGDNSHGTSVASIIAGSLNASGMAGVAPQATILPIAALDPAGYGDSATVAQAIIAAADAGARVINLSLGGPDRDPVLDQACAYAWRRGAVLVAAVGNSFAEGNHVQYPAASRFVLGVAAVDSSGTPSWFSNTGSYVDIAAPGDAVLAATPGDPTNPEVPLYEEGRGTSFAAPHVSGTLALAAAANPGLSPTDLVKVVELTAQDDASGNGRDDQLGFGIVRADRAVSAAAGMASSGVALDARLRVLRVNASPEPQHRGAIGSIAVQVQARYPDRAWRSDPSPALVRFEFRPRGKRTYRLVALVASGPDGWASVQAPATTSGRWRARVQQYDGSWARSKVDFVRVIA